MTDLVSPLPWSTGLPTSPAVQPAPKPQLNVCEEPRGAAERCIFRAKAPWRGGVRFSVHLASDFPLKVGTQGRCHISSPGYLVLREM